MGILFSQLVHGITRSSECVTTNRTQNDTFQMFEVVTWVSRCIPSEPISFLESHFGKSRGAKLTNFKDVFLVVWWKNNTRFQEGHWVSILESTYLKYMSLQRMEKQHKSAFGSWVYVFSNHPLSVSDDRKPHEGQTYQSYQTWKGSIRGVLVPWPKVKILRIILWRPRLPKCLAATWSTVVVHLSKLLAV